ncbi:hypothetical protein NLC93_06300, partial [Candidatus Aminicenantes bacterium AC-335-G13]|nr:hypothetical protein [Candidatus Aminicenantes bacterium AC-335-G13]
MCLSLSTSWFKLDEYTAEKLVNEIIGLDIKKIELQYKIKADFWRKLQPLLKKEGIEVSSIHNFFPVPEILDKGSGDAFLLTSLDENEFNLAIKYSSRTIEIASEIGASAVIFHCGNVPMPKEKMDRVFK